MAQKTSIFEFISYKFEPQKRRIFFNYKTEFKGPSEKTGKNTLFFTEKIILPRTPNLKVVPKEIIEKLLQSLHLIIGISYYKLCCSKNIKTHYKLSKEESDFWNIVYKKGLGEFFYKNKLDPKISPKFPFKENIKPSNFKLQSSGFKSLIGIGGGKDSIVTAELLKEGKFDITGFTVQTNKNSKLIDQIVKKINIRDLKIKRILDKKIFGKHQYSGHIPISAIYAFLGVFSAVLYGYKYFIFGNEYSSNFGNLKYKGQIINHQWSKSFEFENLFQNYVKNFITPDVFCFSLLRPFYEIRVVEMFSNYKKYFPFFSSCNKNFRVIQRETPLSSANLWCRVCAKCVFVFTLLSAFLSKKDLLKILGGNLYQEQKLLPLFKDILGFGNMKPFDCVGTFEEAQTALFLANKKFKNDFIIKKLSRKVKYYPEVFKIQKESSIPDQFKLLRMKNVLILGYGLEGKATEKYLKKYYSNLKIGVADANPVRNSSPQWPFERASAGVVYNGSKQGSGYLKKQGDFDIAVKTPGIKKELVTIPYTTATNIFFSKVIGKNLVIGVTGSKGKSTTSSLIYKILKESGKKVEFLGNIGKPMLERLLKPVDKKTIFVLELSSAQLDDLRASPDISVVTNLFPEHMDYHGTVNNYYEAKRNIINFSRYARSDKTRQNHYFVYNPKNKIMVNWLKNYPGRAVPFSKSIPIKNSEIPLVGEHNKNNIRAAVSVAKILGISDISIKKAIKKFKGLPHRLEFIGQFKGIKFYDDGSSTNPESAIEAIKSLKNISTIFLGGEERGYDFSELEKTIKKYKIKNIVFFPDNGDKIIKNKKGLNILKTSSMKEAVKFAYKNTKKGKICLLSGASPSYSLWKNFSEKGEQFKYFAKKLSQK